MLGHPQSEVLPCIHMELPVFLFVPVAPDIFYDSRAPEMTAKCRIRGLQAELVPASLTIKVGQKPPNRTQSEIVAFLLFSHPYFPVVLKT